MKDKGLVVALVVTLFIKDLWILHPEILQNYNDIPYHKLFPYSDSLITWPTYIYFACAHVVQLIVLRVLWVKFEGYRYLFAVWFWIQSAQFADYFLTYNESKILVEFQLFGVMHRLKIGFTLLKLVLLPAMVIFEDTWKKFMPK